MAEACLDVVGHPCSDLHCSLASYLFILKSNSYTKYNKQSKSNTADNEEILSVTLYHS